MSHLSAAVPCEAQVRSAHACARELCVCSGSDTSPHLLSLLRSASGLTCFACARSFPVQPVLDLTLGAAGTYKDAPRPQSTSLFQEPIMSFVYERGWRQSFAWAGFPGEESEFRQAQEWLAPVAAGGVLLDMSCGSGLFTRRFAASGVYAQVVGVDFSEAMLLEAQAQARGRSVGTPVTLVRADVARLPFDTVRRESERFAWRL